MCVACPLYDKKQIGNKATRQLVNGKISSLRCAAGRSKNGIGDVGLHSLHFRKGREGNGRAGGANRCRTALPHLLPASHSTAASSTPATVPLLPTPTLPPCRLAPPPPPPPPPEPAALPPSPRPSYMQGKSTLDKLSWIAERLGLTELLKSEAEKQKETDADDAESAQVGWGRPPSFNAAPPSPPLFAAPHRHVPKDAEGRRRADSPCSLPAGRDREAAGGMGRPAEQRDVAVRWQWARRQVRLRVVARVREGCGGGAAARRGGGVRCTVAKSTWPAGGGR